MDSRLITWVRENLTYNQAVELAEVLAEISELTRSGTTARVANSIVKAGTGR